MILLIEIEYIIILLEYYNSIITSLKFNYVTLLISDKQYR